MEYSCFRYLESKRLISCAPHSVLSNASISQSTLRKEEIKVRLLPFKKKFFFFSELIDKLTHPVKATLLARLLIRGYIISKAKIMN